LLLPLHGLGLFRSALVRRYVRASSTSTRPFSRADCEEGSNSADEGVDTPRASIPPNREVPPGIPPRLRRCQVGKLAAVRHDRDAPVRSELSTRKGGRPWIAWTPVDRYGRLVEAAGTVSRVPFYIGAVVLAVPLTRTRARKSRTSVDLAGKFTDAIVGH